MSTYPLPANFSRESPCRLYALRPLCLCCSLPLPFTIALPATVTLFPLGCSHLCRMATRHSSLQLGLGRSDLWRLLLRRVPTATGGATCAAAARPATVVTHLCQDYASGGSFFAFRYVSAASPPHCTGVAFPAFLLGNRSPLPPLLAAPNPPRRPLRWSPVTLLPFDRSPLRRTATRLSSLQLGLGSGSAWRRLLRRAPTARPREMCAASTLPALLSAHTRMTAPAGGSCYHRPHFIAPDY